MGEQAHLPECGDGCVAEQPAAKPAGTVAPKWRTAERAQMVMANICVEELIGADRKARAIWELAGRLNLERFAESVKTTAGCAGRPAWDP